MGYDLVATNKKLKHFHFDIFSWPRCVNIFGYLFGMDKRMGTGYPRIFTNDGFKVTALESKIMARMIENYLALEEEKIGLSRWKDQLKRFSKWLKESGGFKIC